MHLVKSNANTSSWAISAIGVTMPVQQPGAQLNSDGEENGACNAQPKEQAVSRKRRLPSSFADPSCSHSLAPKPSCPPIHLQTLPAGDADHAPIRQPSTHRRFVSASLLADAQPGGDTKRKALDPLILPQVLLSISWCSTGLQGKCLRTMCCCYFLDN